MKRQRGHVEPEADLGRRRIEKVRHRLAAFARARIGFSTRRECPVRVCIVMDKIIHHRVDNRPGDLCTAWPIKIGDRMTLMNALECREVRADFVGSSNGQTRRVLGGNRHEVTFDSAVVRVQSAS